MKQTWRNPSNFEAQKFRGRVFVDGSVYLALRTDGKHITNLPIWVNSSVNRFFYHTKKHSSWVGGNSNMLYFSPRKLGEMIQLDYITCLWVGSTTNMTDIPGYSWTSIQRLAKRSARPVRQKSFLGRQIHISYSPRNLPWIPMVCKRYLLSNIAQFGVSKFWRGWFESEEKLQLCNPRSSQNHPQSPDIVCSMACCLRKKKVTQRACEVGTSPSRGF